MIALEESVCSILNESSAPFCPSNSRSGCDEIGNRSWIDSSFTGTRKNTLSNEKCPELFGALVDKDGR